MTTQTVAYTGNEPVTLDEAKNYLRVDFDTDDMLIQGLIEAARSHAESYTNLIIRDATIKVSFEKFQGWYYLNGPVVSITSMALTDEQGTETNVPNTGYFLNRSELPARLYVTHEPAEVVRFVTITYMAGFTDTVIPASIKNAILHMIGDWYENRDDSVRRFPTTARRLLDLERRNYVA